MNPHETLLKQAIASLKQCIQGAQTLVNLYEQGAVEVVVNNNKEMETSINHIMSIVCLQWELSAIDLVSDRRQQNIVTARDVAIWLIRKKYPRLSAKNIGMYFGNRDHTTILHSLDKIRNVIRHESVDPLLRETILNLEKLI